MRLANVGKKRQMAMLIASGNAENRQNLQRGFAEWQGNKSSLLLGAVHS